MVPHLDQAVRMQAEELHEVAGVVTKNLFLKVRRHLVQKSLRATSSPYGWIGEEQGFFICRIRKIGSI